MATITKNVPEPAPQPPVTMDITGLTVAEYMAIWNGLYHLKYGDNQHRKYNAGGTRATERSVVENLMSKVASTDPRGKGDL